MSGIAVAAYCHGRRSGYSAGFEKGCDSGWIDRGIADWHKMMEKRNRLGQFKEKAAK